MELPGVVLTRALTGAKGKSVRVNCNVVRGGRLLAELRNGSGSMLEGFSLTDSVAFEGNEETATLTWAGGKTAVPVDTIQIKFMMYDARLYSFGLH
jgi:hypothetical protein